MDARTASPGHLKVTRQDWLDAATAVLIERGVDQVKILQLSARLKVSRSSFYWYFHDRKELLGALVAHWQTTNTTAFVAACAEPTLTITAGVCQLFRCFVDERLFDARLELAVRDWAKRARPIRTQVARADEARLAALRQMFLRHGYPADEAEVRSRILYYMQIGYYALSPHETLGERMRLVPAYLKSFTGRTPKAAEIAALEQFAKSLS
ncbi:MAG: TetR/AcrR family transcriptional regulator [Hyphomicrobiaceae bacterium]